MGKSKLLELGIAPGSKIMLLGRQHNPQNDEMIQKINKVDICCSDYFILYCWNSLLTRNRGLALPEPWPIPQDF